MLVAILAEQNRNGMKQSASHLASSKRKGLWLCQPRAREMLSN